MLDPALVELVRRHGLLQMEERRAALARAVAQVQARMAGRGLGQSSSVARAILDECIGEARMRAGVLWRSISDVISAAGVRYTPELASDLRRTLREALHFGDIRAIANRMARLMPGAPEQCERALDHTLRALDANVDAFVLAVRNRSESMRTPNDPAPTVFNIHTVGALLTGANASASVVQSFGTEEREALLGALEQVKDALRGLDDVSGVSAREVIELTEECIVEAHKPEPNRLRLGQAAMGIALTIQAIAAAQPAYQALKAALLHMGVQIP